ncbi:MAG: phenylalanine--tRNA ligase subunit beta [Bacteroidales bacterium]|nr:phenylalanine--tRNA ligase subunit beta [Bacteroidales bacterium]
MKISYNWLKEYIQINHDPEVLSRLLTDCGLEVEGLEKVESVKGGLAGIVIGEVLTCAKHPNADKLSVTTVNVGGENPLHIVCGAPNVAAGQKVAVATIGAVMYSGDESFKIKKGKIRGELSEGMICAEDELGLGASHDGIMVLATDAVAGTPAKEYFDLQEDYVFEIGLTPNRSDATSHIGVARDVKAVLNNLKKEKDYELVLPSVEGFKVDNHSFPIEIDVQDEKACPRYTGLTMRGLEVKESPEWMRNRLNAIGVRPINNLVDISNYVLFETGQPLHIFDAAEIKGNKVVVKMEEQGALFVTLDEEKRELSGHDLMICNTEEAMCIAGVFGGVHSGVKDGTTDIFIESAYFDPSTVRKTAKFHGLNTDASFRFERGADINITKYAIKRAAMLIKELAGGEVTSDIVDVYPAVVEPWKVEITYANVDRLIGKQIPHETIKNILTALEIEIVAETEVGLELRIPTNKVDVTREVDVIEEILRIYGYNNIELGLEVHSSLSFVTKPDKEKVQNMIADQLSSNGYSEIMNNSLSRSSYVELTDSLKAENNVTIVNPLSVDLDVMRQSMLFGGLENLAYNINRKEADLKLYEFGKIYMQFPEKQNPENTLEKYFEEKHLTLFATGNIQGESWATAQQKVDFYYLKASVLNILKRVGINVDKLKIQQAENDIFREGLQLKFKKRLLVEFGVINKKINKAFDIKQDVYFADINWDLVMMLIQNSKVLFEAVPKFPVVRRDLALVLDKNVSYNEVEDLARKYGGSLLKKVNLFDIYEGDRIDEGKKSYSVSFLFLDPEKTLTDKDIDKMMNKLIKAFEEQLGVLIRK